MTPQGKPRIEGRDLARALFRLTRLYWTSSDARFGALLLIGAIALQLGTVYANVLVSLAERDVGNALGARDAGAFGRSVALMVGVMMLAVVTPAYSEWVQERLRIRWRKWLTAHFVERWIGPQAYCQADLHRVAVDNPDVRITDDIRDFVASALGLSLTLLSAIVTLVSFSAMLWSISSGWRLPIAGQMREVPGLLLWVAIVFALGSMWITNRVGRRLVPINFDRIRLEADFRYGLVRYRDHVEAVALMNGGDVERRGAGARFEKVVGNFKQLVGAQRDLTILTQGIGVANSLIPLGVAGLAYFADMLSLGVIAQTRFAYGQVAGGLAWFVNAYQEIARWRANIERLSSFADAIDSTAHEFETAGIEISRVEPERIVLDDLSVEGPRGHLLLRSATARIEPGERVAITGPAGSGRTLLMRALAGIWPFGSGRIGEPRRERMFFLAQQPYLPIGTLRAAIAYPSHPEAFADAMIAVALRSFGLEDLVARLDEEEPWAQTLSQQQQQRLALARVLLHEPDWVLLDEATSNLDAETEKRVYETLLERVPKASIVSVVERPGALELLPRRIRLVPESTGTVRLEAASALAASP